jgi:hypothetical protein
LPKVHSLLRPSAADRWMTCFGWLKAMEGLPEKTSIYAEEGQRAHELLEKVLRFDIPPVEATEDIDLALAISTVTNWLTKYLKKHKKADYKIEHWVNWGYVIGEPSLGGTIDLAVIDPEELVVVDYKHGIGIIVDVFDNRQLMLYLLGLVHKFGRRDNYRLIIVQPRARHEDGPIREYPVDDDDLGFFIRDVMYAVKENFKGGKRVAGDHCRFCLAAGSCKTLTRYSLEIAGEEFS